MQSNRSIAFSHSYELFPQMLAREPRPSVEELLHEPWLCYDLDAADSATDPPPQTVAEAAADPAQVTSPDQEAASEEDFAARTRFLKTGMGSSRRNPLLQKLSAVMEAADPREEADPREDATGTPEQGELSSTTASGEPSSSRPSADGLVLVEGASGGAPPLAAQAALPEEVLRTSSADGVGQDRRRVGASPAHRVHPPTGPSADGLEHLQHLL